MPAVCASSTVYAQYGTWDKCTGGGMEGWKEIYGWTDGYITQILPNYTLSSCEFGSPSAGGCRGTYWGRSLQHSVLIFYYYYY